MLSEEVKDRMAVGEQIRFRLREEQREKLGKQWKTL
jgi:hypothetical protein